MHVKTWAALLPHFGEASDMISSGAETSEQSLSWEKLSCFGW